ncbi:MAG: hypothetical protein PUA93_02395 [Eubacteriales bacterium]|nr:hypothetical protein [Eubacteriales bacterium]
MKLKKVLLLLIFHLLCASSVVSSPKISSSSQVARKCLANIRAQSDYWENATLGQEKTFTYGNKSFSLSYVLENDEYKGYLLFDGDNNLCTYYVGSSLPDFSKFESISPIFATGFKMENASGISLSGTTSSEFHATPTLNQDLYTSHYDSFSSSQYLVSSPTYYNYSYGPVKSGCAPTAGAMLVSFYDRYSSMSNLVNGLLPLEHSDNKSAVDSLITTMASYMGTSSAKGTSVSNAMSGLNRYFSDAGYNNYEKEEQ